MRVAGREKQLAQFAKVNNQIAEVYDEQGDTWGARYHRQLATEAQRLLDEGFDRLALLALAANFPEDPDWLHPNPKAVDFGFEIEPWQKQLMNAYLRAKELAVALTLK